MYVSHVPDSQAWVMDALNISWEGLVSYVFCPVTLIPQVIQQMTTYRCRIIMIAPGWPGMSWFLGSGESVHKTPKTSIVSESVDSTIQQQTSQQASLLESSCLALVVSHEYSGRFPEEVVKQLRSLRGTPQGESVNQLVYFGKWCEESQVYFLDPTIPDGANFLNY